MSVPQEELRTRLSELLQSWEENGIPPRWGLQNTLQELRDWRETQGISGLWDPPPLMLTATLDDGWGHGLHVIDLCAQAAGCRVHCLGLLQSAERIVAACKAYRPQLVGLTVLQLDSESALKSICENLPSGARLVVGGPAFQIDRELAQRTGVHFVARNVRSFLEFLLKDERAVQNPL